VELASRLNGLIARKFAAKRMASRNSRAIASITFDDFPQSAWTIGGRLLTQYGARGTYYAAGSLAGQTIDGVKHYDAQDLTALAAAGHEIGSHGFGHEPVPTLSSNALADDLSRNEAFLKPFLSGGAPESYAFPFGAVSYASKRYCGRQFSTARGVHPGVNAGMLDLAQLCTVAIERRLWSESAMAAHIAAAIESRGWIVFHTHDVDDDASPYGCTPAMLESVLKQLTAAGIQVLPMREALAVVRGAVA